MILKISVAYAYVAKMSPKIAYLCAVRTQSLWQQFY